MEAYFVDDINVKEKGDVRLHLTLLAKNKIGYKNLIAMSSIANLKGFYSKPRIDLNVLKAHKEGIICGSACVHGIASYYILNNDVEKARSNLVLFNDLFGDDFYVEIMLHQYNDEKKTRDFKLVMKKLYELAQELGIMSVATCDSHYANKEDSKSHDVLLCISTKDTIKNKERFTFGSEDFYIKSFDEMMQRCPKNPAIVTNSVLIANKIEDGIIEVGKDLLPDFPLPPGETSESKYLKSLIIDGMKEKGLYDKSEYMDRFDEEMSVILGCHFEKYFLILWDVIAFARREGIRVGPGRGCFLPNNKVITQNGMKNIEKVVVGDDVLSYDGEFHKVKNSYEYDIDEDVIFIETSDGRTVSCTQDHEIQMVDKDGIEKWVSARELVEGDEIVDIRIGTHRG
jgi:DNA polymerase-3 subunit alpha